MARSETERALATTIAKLAAENKELKAKNEALQALSYLTGEAYEEYLIHGEVNPMMWDSIKLQLFELGKETDNEKV